MLAIAKCAETYKPLPSDGSTKEINMKMVLAISNTSSITLKIDPTIIFAKKKDVDEVSSRVDALTTQLSDLVYQTAGGTATAITLTMQSLVNGYAKTFIAGASNNGATTTINGKSLYKPNTTTAPNLIAGKAYTVWYNSSKDCFFIKASAEGNTIATHVLAGDTFSNDSDTGLLGTMPNNGALNSNLNCGGTFKVPAGYTTGGTITANSLASQTSATADQTKILNGYSAWVNGNLVNGNAHKYDYASGTSAPVCVNSSTCTYYLNMTGLTSFIPDLVLIQYATTGGGTCYAMLNNTGIGPKCMWNYYGNTNKSYTVYFSNTDSISFGFTGADYAHIPIVYHWLTSSQSDGFAISTVNWAAYKFY